MSTGTLSAKLLVACKETHWCFMQGNPLVPINVILLKASLQGFTIAHGRVQ